MFFGAIGVLALHAGIIAFSRARTGTTFLNVMIVDAGGPPLAVADAHYLNANNFCLDRIKESPNELHDFGLRLRNMDRVLVNCPSEDRADWAHILKSLGVRAEIPSPILEKMDALDLQKKAVSQPFWWRPDH